jgi:D-beta-D-heptose 7-phosphate kinase/D-beta-D-heptose 1-phosphate adenosyltransferase
MEFHREFVKGRNKIKTIEELQELCAVERQRGNCIVFTNGCFDLLHVGHLRYLEAARDLGDVLVVGVNSDASVHMIKGLHRPVVGQEERSELVAALHCVDYVTVFDTLDPLHLIELLKPDILVKGADWPEDKIIGAQVVRERGGEVIRIPLIQDISTTAIIEKIVSRFNKN